MVQVLIFPSTSRCLNILMVPILERVSFEMVCYIASKYRTLVFGYPYQMVIYIILTMPSRPHFDDRLYVRIL